jgi:hypothetical protein
LTSGDASVELSVRRVGHRVGLVEVVLRWVLLDGLPSFAVVQLHPVVLSIFQLPGVLQRLGEQIAEVVVVGSVLEAEVSHIREILVELLCD